MLEMVLRKDIFYDHFIPYKHLIYKLFVNYLSSHLTNCWESIQSESIPNKEEILQHGIVLQLIAFLGGIMNLELNVFRKSLFNLKFEKFPAKHRRIKTLKYD